MTKKRELTEYIFLLAAVFSAILTTAVLVFLLFYGWPLLKTGQLSQLLFASWRPAGELYGVFPMLKTSFLLAAMAMLIGFPLSLGCSFFIYPLAPKCLQQPALTVVRIMTTVPTVVYSFAALFFLVPLMRELVRRGSGMSILTASLVLAVVISPTMILFFVNSFRKVDRQYILAADALGGSAVQKLIYIIVPQSYNGIINGTLLGFGRALGDTMVSLMLAGNSTNIPTALTDSARSLTAHIALVIAYDFDSLEFKSIFICGAVLYIATALVMLGCRLTNQLLTGKKNAKNG